MNANVFMKLSESLVKAFPDSTIGKWESHDDHEEIEINDNLGTYKIRFFSKERS